MSNPIVLEHCSVFDGVSDEIRDGMCVVIEGDLIRDVGSRPPALANAQRLDCRGRFLMPGLIDLHFHAYSATFDLQWLDRMPKPLLVAHAFKHLQSTLERGFTAVRDPGGGDIGLSMAIERRLTRGPRFYYGGKALSQTGGHGDLRSAHHEEPCNCAYSGVISQVVDGVDEVRRVAREELRKGADHIKVFISGGVASPTDPIWMPQFTNSELTAAVEEARTRRKYVIAHCHTDDGARRCVEVGIRSIDHATTVSDATAKLIADSGTSYTVPTLAVIHQVTESEIPVMVDVVMRDEDGSDVPQGKPRRHHLSLNSIADIEKIDVGSDHHGIRRLRPVEPRQRPTSRPERHELSAGLLELWRGFVTFCVGRCDSVTPQARSGTVLAQRRINCRNIRT